MQYTKYHDPLFGPTPSLDLQHIILRKQNEYIEVNTVAFETFLKQDPEYIKALAESIGENQHGQDTSS